MAPHLLFRCEGRGKHKRKENIRECYTKCHPVKRNKKEIGRYTLNNKQHNANMSITPSVMPFRRTSDKFSPVQGKVPLRPSIAKLPCGFGMPKSSRGEVA
jgi:hypothetical protein